MARSISRRAALCTVLLALCQIRGAQAAGGPTVHNAGPTRCMLAFHGGPAYCYPPSRLQEAEGRAGGRVVSPVHIVRHLTGLRLSQVIDLYTFRGPIVAVDYIFGGTWHVSGAQQPGMSGRYLDVEEIFQDGRPVDVPGRTLSLSTASSLPPTVVREVVASLLRSGHVKHVVQQHVNIVAAAGSASTPHPVFSFGRGYAKFLPYSVTLRSDGAVVARSDAKRVVKEHVVSDTKLKTLVQTARRAGFLRWPGLLVPKSPQDPEAPNLFITFEYRTVLTLPVHTAATRAFYRLLGRLMRASRLRFCSQPNESTVTPCVLIPK